MIWQLFASLSDKRLPMALGLLLFPLSLSSAHAETWQSRDAVRALTDGALSELSAEALVTASEVLLYGGSITEARMQLSVPEALALHRQSTQLLRRAKLENPRLSTSYWQIARNNYETGELLPEDAVPQRQKLYEEMIELTTKCVEEVNPEDANCWHYQATGMGRLATTKGIMSSLSLADDVEQAWLKAVELGSNYSYPFGAPLKASFYAGLGMFYRLLPDSWFVELLTGSRGDKEKTVAYFQKAVEVEPKRIEWHKELGIAFACLGDDDDRPELIAKGIRILTQVSQGAIKGDGRATDTIDKQHAAELIQKPSMACGYSRDGYEDTRKSS